MEYVSLTHGTFALVDDRDFASVSRFKWYVTSHGYARTGVHMGYLGGKKKMVYMYLHRLILRPPEGMDIDHRNHNTLDCRRANMRICTRSQNMQNQITTKGTSKYKGVCWIKREAKWSAGIKLNARSIHIGLFDDEIEAARSYDAAARELFGEFARTNLS